MSGDAIARMRMMEKGAEKTNFPRQRRAEKKES
jgi:hypothetical protein